MSVFAVVVTYAMLMIDVRHAYNLGAPTLQGGMSQSEFYAYSIGTLAFGLGLLIGGVAAPTSRSAGGEFLRARRDNQGSSCSMPRSSPDCGAS